MAALGGRRGTAHGWVKSLQRGLDPPGIGTSSAAPSTASVAAHGVVAAGAGVLAWIAAALLALFVFRGLLYGVVVPGPYDEAWGGPTLAGAWIVHALVGLALAVLALELLRTVDALYTRLSTRLLTGNGPAWEVPISVLLTVLVGLLLWNWASQNL